MHIYSILYPRVIWMQITEILNIYDIRMWCREYIRSPIIDIQVCLPRGLWWDWFLLKSYAKAKVFGLLSYVMGLCPYLHARKSTRLWEWRVQMSPAVSSWREEKRKREMGGKGSGDWLGRERGEEKEGEGRKRKWSGEWLGRERGEKDTEVGV